MAQLKNTSKFAKMGNVDLLHGPILQSLLLFGLPLLVSYAFQQFYSAVDTMIVGNCLGDVSLAAIGSCASIYELFVGFGMGVGNGMGIVVARAYGSKDDNRLKQAVAGTLQIGIGVVAVLMVLGALFLRPLLVLLGTPAEILDEAYSYIIVISWGVGAMFAYNLFSGLLRSIGDSFMPLVFLIFASLLNIGLDLYFIMQLHMGVMGTAVATVIAQGISAVLCLLYILKFVPLLIPQRSHWKVPAPLFKDLFTQGLSMGLMQGIVSVGSVILQYGINSLGTLTIAGHTAARKVYSFLMLPPMALTLANSTFVGQNRGANQKERIRQGVRCVNLLSIAWAVILTVLMLFAADPLMRLVSGSEEPTVIQYGTLYVQISAPFFSVLGILLCLRTTLQALGYKVIPLISSVIEFLGKIIFVVLVVPRLKALGVMLCEPIIWCVMCAQLAWSYYRNPYMSTKEE